ncbi:Transposase [Rhizobiales bacterium GAS188]|nr:Transposase [Rhizobiales bacterium GAS188]
MSRSIFSAPHFNDEVAAYAYVEARIWANGRVCPHCGVMDRSGALKGKSDRVGLYKCYACRKPFTVKIGTIFESSHIQLRDWLTAIQLICSSKKGISAHQLHRTLDITLKSAWFLGHRIREAMKEKRGLFTPPMGGEGAILEADETFVGGRGENRTFKEPAPKKIVMALVQRGGGVRSFHVPNVTANTLRSVVGRHAHSDSHFVTDEAHAYTGIGWNFASHETVTHSEKEYVRGDVHTNTVEGYFSILKRGIMGVYHHVSEAHLHRYLSEFDFRYSNRIKLGVDDAERRARTERRSRQANDLPHIWWASLGRGTRPRDIAACLPVFP